MEYLTIAQAADRLSISPQTAHVMVAAGRMTDHNSTGTGPALVTAADVAKVAAERRTEALRRIGDEEAYARRTVAILHPTTITITRANGATDPDSLAAAMAAPRGRDALRVLVGDPAYALWGRHVLEACAARVELADQGVCPACWARTSARVHRTREPDGSRACRILLGNSCELDETAWQAQTAAGQAQMRQMRQRLQGQQVLDRTERINRERTASLRAVQTATARFTAADKAWRALPANLRWGGR